MHLFIDILRNSILISGLVVVMMMMIESLNIESRGLFFKGLRRSRFGQVVIASILGSIPGCMGGFATVSLYTHRMMSFGALVAMMIASTGDEAFPMLAMFPDKALMLMAILFVLAIVTGVVTDLIYDSIHKKRCVKEEHHECGAGTDCQDGYEIHEHDHCSHRHPGRKEARKQRHFTWRRAVMFAGLALFIAALATGHLGHDHGGHSHDGEPTHCECSHGHGYSHEHEDIHSEDLGIDLLSEDWMNVLFAALSIIVLFVLIFASDHFVEGHLWNHIIKKHLPTIFAWTFGVLLVMGIALQHIDIKDWISDNTAVMIVLATLIGIIPESGPHLIFVTLFATGVIPFPVLLASSISQDGHASIPLLAESRMSFAWAKLINCIVAMAAGFAAMLIF